MTADAITAHLKTGQPGEEVGGSYSEHHIVGPP